MIFSPLIYFVVKNLVWLILKIFWRMDTIGASNVPQKGGVIMAANHRSLVDPPVVGSALKRTVHFLAKEELFAFKPFGWFISNLNAHPLRRSGDVRAFKMALRLLRSGHAVILFPEGRRSKTDQLQKAKPGVGLLSQATGCPILPVYIHNTGYFKKFRKIRVCFGSMLHPADFTSDQEMADRVMVEIQKMKTHVEAQI